MQQANRPRTPQARALMRTACVVAIVGSLLVGTAVSSSASTDPSATASISKRYAKRLLRENIRDGWDVASGSIRIRECYHRRGAQGRPMVECSDVSFETVHFTARCGYGWVREYTTFTRSYVHAPRC